MYMYMYMYNVHVGEQNNESEESHYNDYILYMLHVTKCVKRDFYPQKRLPVTILPLFYYRKSMKMVLRKSYHYAF